MPAPRTYDLPGRWGINLQEKDALLNPNWATKTEGLVMNDSERIQCRGGLNIASTDGAAGEILRAHIYIDADGDETIITSQATKIVSGVADLDDAGTDITSSTTPTNGFWKFLNFNGKCLGWQAGEAPIVKTTGDFADISASAGTLPDGDVALAAFGRVWAVDDDRQTIRYCALLDEADWSTASGGGSIDMRNVWTKGMDYVTGLAAFGSALIVFGRNHIVIWADGQGSSLGIDPLQMYVVDTIEGTGCIARDSIASVGEGDLVFLSPNGVQSLRRLIAQKDNPLDTISWQIEDRLQQAITAEISAQSDPKLDVRGFTGNYIAETGQYWLIHNAGSIEDVYIFQMTSRQQDDKGRQLVPIMFWDTSVLSNMRNIIETNDKTIYVTGGATHELYEYDLDTNTDEGSADIPIEFESGWIEDEDPMLKVLKFGQVTLLNLDQVSSATTFKYATDYEASLDSITAPASSDGRIVNLYDPVGDVEGQYFKIGITDPGFGGKVIQQIKLFLEPGRVSFIHQKFDDYTLPQALEDAGGVDVPITVNGDGDFINSIREIGNYELDTSGTTEDTLEINGTPDADAVIVVVMTQSGYATRGLSANYGNANSGVYTDLNGLDGTVGSTSYMAYAECIPITAAASDNTLRLQWTSAPSADQHLWVKVIPLVNTGATVVPSNTDTVQKQNVGTDATIDFALTTAEANSMCGIVLLVAPETALSEPYTVANDQAEFDDNDQLWEPTYRPQVNIFLARDVAISTDIGGTITVTGPAANTAGSLYAFEVNTSY